MFLDQYDCVVVKTDFPYMLQWSELIFWSINIVSKDDGNWVLCRKKPNFYKNDRHVMSRLMFWFLVFVMPRHNILCLYLLSIITNCGLCCKNTAINIICHLAYTKSLLVLFRNPNHTIHKVILRSMIPGWW